MSYVYTRIIIYVLTKILFAGTSDSILWFMYNPIEITSCFTSYNLVCRAITVGYPKNPVNSEKHIR